MASALVISSARLTSAQTFNSGSTGADGAFNPSCTPTPCAVTVTLPVSGKFNFTTINIGAGITVKFTHNAANTPVTLLAQGDPAPGQSSVVIGGALDVSGTNGLPGASGQVLAGSNNGTGGPGGFDGGSGANTAWSQANAPGANGLGPGGGGEGQWVSGARSGAGGGFGTVGQVGYPGAGGAPGGLPYGTPTLLPLIGGSGGGGGAAGQGSTGDGGGGGGGAIVVAASGTITLAGTVISRGGAGGSSAVAAGGGGSGGAVRLVATTITGGGSISVSGGQGSFGFGAGGIGRIRIEAFNNMSQISVTPGLQASLAQPSSVTLTTVPILRFSTIANVSVPASPGGTFGRPDVVLPASTTSPVTVVLTASNIPPGPLTVTLTGQTGSTFDASYSGTLVGTPQSSTATVTNVAIPLTQPFILSASITFTRTSWLGSGPLFVEGEEVECIRVASTLGGLSAVTYVTASGREVVVALR